jgi:hypothetical protein
MEKEYLIIKLRALMLDIIGVEIYHLDIDEDLRNKKSFDAGCEEKLEECINDDFHIDIDIKSLKPLTMDKIAAKIIKNAKEPTQCYPGVKDMPIKPEEKKTLDYPALKLLIVRS